MPAISVLHSMSDPLSTIPTIHRAAVELNDHHGVKVNELYSVLLSTLPGKIALVNEKEQTL